MRHALIVLCTVLWAATSAVAQVSIGITIPGISIGINVPVYPDLVQVPRYPVYYAPRANANYFFFDGMYWVYQGDHWYASSWYNGPWGRVSPEAIPLFVLRIPVRYYRDPPAYFRRWQADAPPRWGEHWGRDWEEKRRGWDQWNRKAVPRPAPLPTYQRQYSHDRYPQIDQQRSLHNQSYRYQPHEPIVRQHYQEQAAPRSSQSQRQPQAQDDGGRRRENDRSSTQTSPSGRDGDRSSNQRQGIEQQTGSAGEGHRQPKPVAQQESDPRKNQREGRESTEEQGRGQGQDKGRDKGKDTDRGR